MADDTNCGKGDYDGSGSCSDCSSNANCKHDKGIYQPSDNYDSVSNTTDCGNTYYSDWTWVHSVDPAHESSEAFDEITEGTHKIFYINSWFTDTPDAMLDSYCDHSESAYPDEYSVQIRHPDESDPEDEDKYNTQDYWFDKPRPDGSDSSTWDPVVDVAAGVVAGATSSYTLSAAALAAPHFIDEYAYDPVTLSQDETDLQQKWQWDIAVDGGFPTSNCDANDIRFDIVAEVAEPDRKVNSWSKQSFWVPYYNTGYCACQDSGITHNLYSTGWTYRDFCFDIIK